MFPYTVQEIAQTLRNAKNANAALKNFLKHELRGGDSAERFVKDLKSAVGNKRPEALERLIALGLPKFETHLFVILRYAYSDACGSIAEKVVTEYADNFNKTFERSQNSIAVKDPTNFKKITSEVLATFEKGLSEHGIASSGLMKNVLITFVFDADVIQEIFRGSTQGS